MTEVIKVLSMRDAVIKSGSEPDGGRSETSAAIGVIGDRCIELIVRSVSMSKNEYTL